MLHLIVLLAPVLVETDDDVSIVVVPLLLPCKTELTVIPEELVLRIPVLAAAPQLVDPLAPVLVETDDDVSIVVVPLLFPCKTELTVIPAGTPDVGVSVLKFQ